MTSICTFFQSLDVFGTEEDVEGGLASQLLVSGGQRGVAGVEARGSPAATLRGAIGAGGRW